MATDLSILTLDESQFLSLRENKARDTDYAEYEEACVFDHAVRLIEHAIDAWELAASLGHPNRPSEGIITKPLLDRVVCCRDREEVSCDEFGGRSIKGLVSACRSMENFWKALANGIEERIRLETMPYVDYLKTQHWSRIREEAHVCYNYRCVLCGSNDQLNVHHRSYENRGAETMRDVVLLCQDCHAKFHDKLPG